MAVMMAGAVSASLALPAHSAELRMGVSAVVLSHCSMQLTSAAITNINSLGAEPFTARCNTPMAPRVRSGSAGLAGSALPEALAMSTATNAPRAQSEVISTTDDARRIVEYIQYTIEY